MRKPRLFLAVLALLGVAFSLAVPAEDAPETAYDESEALPYVGTPLFSIDIPHASARTTRAEPAWGGDSWLRFDCSLKTGNGRREDDVRPSRVSDSLTILNRSLRC